MFGFRRKKLSGSYFFLSAANPITRAIAAANPVFVILAKIVHVDGTSRERLQRLPEVAGPETLTSDSAASSHWETITGA